MDINEVIKWVEVFDKISCPILMLYALVTLWRNRAEIVKRVWDETNEEIQYHKDRIEKLEARLDAENTSKG